MKKFEICSQFIGEIWTDIEANTAEEAKEIFFKGMGTKPVEIGGQSVTLENVSLPISDNFKIEEMNICFLDEITPDIGEHWQGFDIEEKTE